MTDRIVIESPLAGDFARNYRFLLWCCRAMWLRGGFHAIGSHMLNPWFMNDQDAAERQAGIDNPWVWDCDAPHVFFTDLGVSRGMTLARERCECDDIPHCTRTLREYDPESFAAFERGEWPPSTPGFVLATGEGAR